MKYLLAICLLLPVLAPAQHNKYESLGSLWFKDSAGQHVKLPPKRAIDLYLQRHLYTNTSSGLVVSADSAYKALFNNIRPDSLPVIDFSTQYLLGRRACIYCGAHCTHQTCHRNACSYIIFWVIMPKEEKIDNNQ